MEKYLFTDPGISRFKGETFVVKYGGAAMISEELQEAFAGEIVFLGTMGIRIVIVHGGGKEITALAARLGLTTTFVRGQRYTDGAMMDVVQMVLAGKLNQDIVARINSRQGSACGVSGIDAGLLKVKNAGGDIDLGFVGQIEHVKTGYLYLLLKNGFVPVVAPVGCDDEGQVYNINADVAAAEIAGALRADRLLMLSDVDGVYSQNGKRVDRLDEFTAEGMIAKGEITGGMIPKMRSAFSALRRGVGGVHLIDGRVKHALLREIASPATLGTCLVSNSHAAVQEMYG